MHWMNALALRNRKESDAIIGETPWLELLCEPWVSFRETNKSLLFLGKSKYGVNWNISVAPGKELNRDSVSSGERKRIRLKEIGDRTQRNRMEYCAKEGESPV